MENYILTHDITVMYVTATSFPDGIQAAFTRLGTLVPGRHTMFGLSSPVGGKGIIYKAATAEQHEGEAAQLGLETYTIKKGTYTSTVLHNFMSNLPAIGATFQQLLAHPNIDHEGCCVEWYLNENDVRLMVRLED